MKLLIAITWLAPILAIPLYFFALIGWGMSATSSANASIGELAQLVVCPCVSLIALVKLLSSGGIKPLTAVCLFIPGLLSLAELVFVVVLWRSG